MHTKTPSRLVIFVLSLCASWMCPAATPNTQPSSAPASMIVQLSPEAGYIDLDSADRTTAQRQASTPVRVTVTSTAANTIHRIAIYACISTEEAMRAAGKASALATANLRIRNDRGEWTDMQPLAELQGSRGVRIAVVTGGPATILLEVELRIPANQTAGNYRGVLMLQAQEQR